MDENDRLADPHRVRTVEDIKWLFRRANGRTRTTCDYCSESARKTAESDAVAWFRDHACRDEAGRATEGRKHRPTLSDAAVRVVERAEQRRRFWARAQRSPYDLLNPDAELQRDLEQIASEMTVRRQLDELAARRTVKGERVTIQQQLARIEQRLDDHYRVTLEIATRLRDQQRSNPAAASARAQVVDLAEQRHLRRAA